jgi:hypothetical protein
MGSILSHQQVTGGNAGSTPSLLICVLFVFPVLAAQYGSWSLPFAVILTPMCLLGRNHRCGQGTGRQYPDFRSASAGGAGGEERDFDRGACPRHRFPRPLLEAVIEASLAAVAGRS